MIFSQVFIVIVAIFHIMFFKIESIDFMKPKVLKKFDIKQNDAHLIKIWAYNQGFYNLFLALGLIYSLFLINSSESSSGILLAKVILLIITGAGAVLLSSNKKLKLAAALQSIPALISLILLHFHL